MSAKREPRRALIVLNCGLQIPSAMVRAMQFRPFFERSQAWRAEFVSRRSERLVRLLNRTDRPRIPLMKPLVHGPLRALSDSWERKHEDAIVQQAKQFDLVYIVKIPYLRLYERLRALNGPKVVMDMNDGLWLPAFQSGDWKPLDQILAACDAVIAENDHVAGYARKHSRCVHVVPDSPQIEVFDRWRDEVRRDPAKVVLGWVGSPENVGALYRILEPLEALFAKHPHLHLRVVGADASILPRFENVRWSNRAIYDQEIMVRETLAFDIGLFPMFRNGDGLARGNLKAMIYMSAGAAAICENYGENPNLIRDGANGMLAATPEEWLAKLDHLVTHTLERESVAQRGLETIRTNFTAEQVFERLTAAFDEIMQG
jgi:glycosyltransferase involved in cell wall biosynthesis